MKLIIILTTVLSVSAVTVDPSEDFTNLQGFATHGNGTYGGKGGKFLTIYDASNFEDAIRTDEPAIVHVRGRIYLTELFEGSPGIILDVGSRKTIFGDNNAEIIGGGLRIKNKEQVIIRNVKFSNALSYAPGEVPNGNGGISNQRSIEFTEVDAIGVEASQYVWIDHNEFSDDPWIADNIPTKRNHHDGLIDIKKGSNWITISNNIFRNHNKNSLVGHSDKNSAQDVGKLKVSFIGNWFKGTKQRNPRVRFGEVHVLNNLFTDNHYGIGVGAGSSIYSERNVFINTVAWKYPSGTPNPQGYLLNVNNMLKNSTFIDIPNDVQWKPSSYYNYTPIPVEQVEDHVKLNAGTFN